MAHAVLWAASAGSVSAQEYPSRPIRLVVGFPPGSALDTTARTISGKLSELLRQNVIVDNRPGVGGNIQLVFSTLPPAIPQIAANMAWRRDR